MRWLVTMAGLWLCVLPSALAQPNDWLVLPTTVEDGAPWMSPAVEKIRRALRSQGIGVWSSERAVSAFRERGAAAPPVVSESEVQAWEARSQQGLRALAFGDYASALSELQETQRFARSKLVTLNREPARAQMVLDTCLYLVRALAETGDDKGADHQSAECVRIAPAAKPTRHMHPPAVVERYETALARKTTHLGALLVESEPPGCPLRVNGAPEGETPVQLKDLYPGRYLVQVECEKDIPSSVHVADVPQGSTSIFVFDRFDRSVQTAPLLYLRYQDPPELSRLARDAREVARALPAAAVVLASATSADVLELRVVSRTQIEPALARIPISSMTAANDAVTDALAALLAGECWDFTHDEPLQLDCRTGKPRIAAGAKMVREKPARVHSPRGQFISGLTLASAGTASLLAGYGVLIGRRAAGDNWLGDPGSLDAHSKWLNLGTGLIISGSTGSAMLVTAMPLVLPYKSKTPWWAWLSGGLGLGFAASSIAFAVTADSKPAQSCSINNLNPEPCTSRAKQTDLALILGVTAAPLLTMPLVYLFRKGEKRLAAELAPNISVDRSGATLGVSGAF